jgi:hypothetical protein
MKMWEVNLICIFQGKFSVSMKMWEVNLINDRNDSAGVLTIIVKFCISSIATVFSSVLDGLRYCSSKF